jgi:hypothetical protein
MDENLQASPHLGVEQRPMSMFPFSKLLEIQVFAFSPTLCFQFQMNNNCVRYEVLTLAELLFAACLFILLFNPDFGNVPPNHGKLIPDDIHHTSEGHTLNSLLYRICFTCETFYVICSYRTYFKLQMQQQKHFYLRTAAVRA